MKRSVFFMFILFSCCVTAQEFRSNKFDFHIVVAPIDNVVHNVVPKVKHKPKPINITSDVDKNIPETSTVNDNTFVVVIANENYTEVSEVPFAIHDGETFSKYCNLTLGIPSENIRFRKNATYGNIKQELSWIMNLSESYNGDAKLIFYYAGHGIPDESNKSAYLLPIDGTGTDVSVAYPLGELYKTLGELDFKSVSVFLDACFSGSNRDEGMIASARGVAIKVNSCAPRGNTVVFTAAQGDETAYPYKEKGHGLFTYFLLKKIQETEGDITYGELSAYIKDQVCKKSIVANSKKQTPNILASSELTSNWSDWNLK